MLFRPLNPRRALDQLRGEMNRLVNGFTDQFGIPWNTAGRAQPAVNVWEAVRYMAPGVMAHKSALRDGEVLEVPELKTDPRFQERDTRKKHRQELTPLLEARLTQKPTGFWVGALNAKDVPSGEILGLEEALRQPQIAHRGVLQKVRVGGVGEIEVFGLTALFEKTPGSVDAPPPALGEHNAEVYGGLGLSEAELAELKSKGVI